MDGTFGCARCRNGGNHRTEPKCQKSFSDLPLATVEERFRPLTGGRELEDSRLTIVNRLKMKCRNQAPVS